MEAEVRAAFVNMIYDVFKKNKVPKAKSQAAVLEEHIYQYAEQKGSGSLDHIKIAYRNKMKSMLENLDPKSEDVENAGLILKVKSGEVALADLVEMKPWELFPEKWEDIVRKMDCVEEIKKAPKGNITTQETCRKCHQNICTMMMIQSRSVDEGSTIHYECVNCGHKWRG